MQNHYTRERNTKYNADLLGITPKYLSQVVYKVSGRFASDFITELVIAESKSLIRGGGLTMQQISDRLHFVSPSAFSRYFKKATGISPSEYQEKE